MRYRVSRALETIVLRRAHRVVAICEGIRSEVLSRGVPPGRVALVPNGVGAEWLEPRARATDLAAQLGLGAGPVFGYIGSSPVRSLPVLIGATAELVFRIPGPAALVEAGATAGGRAAVTGRRRC